MDENERPEDKKEERKSRNRASAKLSRQRQKAHVNNLEEQILSLRLHIASLERENASLRAAIASDAETPPQHAVLSLSDISSVDDSTEFLRMINEDY